MSVSPLQAWLQYADHPRLLYADQRQQSLSSIELDCAGVRIHLHGRVDAEALRTVLAVVRDR